MKIGKIEIQVREIIILILFIVSLVSNGGTYVVAKDRGVKEGTENTEIICAETLNGLLDYKPESFNFFVRHPNETQRILNKTMEIRTKYINSAIGDINGS